MPRSILVAVGAVVAVVATITVGAKFSSERAAEPIQQLSRSDEPGIETAIEPAIDEEKIPPPRAGVKTPPRLEREVLVSFPDGTAIPVRLRGLPPPPHTKGCSEHLTDCYADLRRRAEGGDAGAAAALYKKLTRCKRAYADEGSLKEAIERLRRERVVTFPDASQRSLSLHRGADVAAFEQVELREPYEYCKGITNPQRHEADQWLRIAVEGGDVWALNDWATQLGGTREGVEAWEGIWKQGYAVALPPLAVWYSKGIPAIRDGQPDHMRAYAYKFINFKLLEGAHEDSTSPLSSRMLIAVEDSLLYTGAFLTPQQTAEAIELAKNLLIGNANCCVGNW